MREKIRSPMPTASRRQRSERLRSVSAAQRYRALVAIAIVAGLVALPCAVDAAVTKVQASAHLAEALGGGSEADVPAWFSEELFGLQGYSDVRTVGEGAVVGFSAQGNAVDVFAQLAEAMVRKGWVLAESGISGSGAFVKSEGRCRWAWLSCADISGSTSVVVQCAYDESGPA